MKQEFEEMKRIHEALRELNIFIIEAEEVADVLEEATRKLIKIADKYGLDRDEVIRRAARSLVNTTAQTQFKNVQLEEGKTGEAI